MKRLVAMAAFALIFMVASVALAQGVCPQRSSNLADFANCMVPMQSGNGTMYRGTLADMQGDHSMQLLASMNRMPVAMPTYTGGIPAGVWGPMMSVAAHKAYSDTSSHATFWTWYTMNGMAGLPYYYPY